MGELTIALEEGFDDTHVVVSVNGVKQIDDPAVSTRPQISLARRLTVAVSEGPVTVDIELPGSGLTKRIDLGEQRESLLHISISDGAITHRMSDERSGNA